MRVLIAYNARSGRGRARRLAQSAAEVIRREPGFEVIELAVGPGLDTARLDAALSRCEAAFVAGGDGTVHHAVPALIRAGVPVYHLPAGNENLFAREFGSSAEGARLAEALRLLSSGRGRLRVDLAGYRVNGGVAGHFVLMCSFGADASVIHRLSGSRRRAVGHRAYVGPLLREVRRPRFPGLRVRVDGREVVAGEPGFLVIANSRQYALRLDPARRASVTDGLLDVVFLPCVSAAEAVGWALKAAGGRHLRDARARYVQGREIQVGAEGAPFQIDGECPGEQGGGLLDGTMDVWVRRGELPVLAEEAISLHG